ncbi:MAG: hydrogenase expression/formation protein HypE [Desulfobulbaceae bacterium]|nr:hydrogenase expression/formation protein HypE [Desulfobulbaceae bacterium]
MSDRITIDHGSGGRASLELLQTVFLAGFDNDILNATEDSALITINKERLAFTTDSYVVDPIFFPGGNIGDLAVNGTINDLAMRGATPLYLSVGMILEEGLAIDDLKTIVATMRKAADNAGVKIVAGDTKVVPVGKADKIFINTTGIGVVAKGVEIGGSMGQPGDKIIISGTMADHGITILCQREGLAISGEFTSDSAPLNKMVEALLAKHPDKIHVLRDPTRGGVATTLKELAISSAVGINIKETDLPIRADVQGACDLLGVDPLYLANEGKLLAFVAPEIAEQTLALLRQQPHGENAAIIGEVVADHPGEVVLETVIGSRRRIDMLHGQPLPRIC